MNFLVSVKDRHGRETVFQTALIGCIEAATRQKKDSIEPCCVVWLLNGGAPKDVVIDLTVEECTGQINEKLAAFHRSMMLSSAPVSLPLSRQ